MSKGCVLIPLYMIVVYCTFFALDCYLLGRFSTDLNQIGHGGSCQAGSTPREVEISKFQTVPWKWKVSVYDGARQPRTFW